MTAEVPRDHLKRPLIKVPGKDKLVPYRRASSFGDAIVDKEGLALWNHRNTAIGLYDEPGLLSLVEVFRDQPGSLNALCAKAQELAGSKEGAEWGTEFHSWAEALDGVFDPLDWLENVTEIPTEMVGDLRAYYEATRAYDWPVLSEAFVVCDELQVAGTFDQLREWWPGVYGIGDIKTGKDPKKVVTAVQLAIYAHSELYDPETGERTPFPVEVDQERGVVIHVPMKQGTANLLEVDLVEGWRRAKLAKRVYDEGRSIRGLFKPFAA